MPHLVITAGQAGLVKADFGFRFYRAGVPDAAVVTGLTVIPRGSGLDYEVQGLPVGARGEWLTLTWEYPAGTGFSHVYPAPYHSIPPNLVLPVRETGLSASDLGMTLYKNGLAHGAVLTATEVNPGDYRVAGWPTNETGSWLLVWRRHDVSYNFPWSATYAGLALTTTEVTYHAEDLEAAAAVMGRVTRAAGRVVVGNGWMGFYERGENIPFPAEPTTDPQHRTCFGVWWLRHTSEDRALDRTASPSREGEITLRIFHQPGLRDSDVARLLEVYRQAFQDAADPIGMAYNPGGVPKPPGSIGGWPVTDLVIPFKAEY